MILDLTDFFRLFRSSKLLHQLPSPATKVAKADPSFSLYPGDAANTTAILLGFLSFRRPTSQGTSGGASAETAVTASYTCFGFSGPRLY